ncbi:MAG TPA: response regulator transcription factor [Longimicrobiales bacterium]|nr:response regulator transcription factor [Longimicrobiales bacterium]
MPQASAIRVLIAVQDDVAAMGLRTILSVQGEMECLPLPGALHDVRGLVAGDPPDVLLLDVDLRREDPRLLPDLVESFPDLRVLVYVDHAPEDCALRHMLEPGGRARLSPEALARLDDCCLTSLRQRAHGCLGTGVEARAVVESVRSVHAGEVVAAPWLASLARMIHSPGGKARAGSPISVRELEIMTLLAQGLSNRLIAERLGIREQTVKNHVTRTMDKLGVSNRLEVGLLAARHNLRLADAEDEEVAG